MSDQMAPKGIPASRCRFCKRVFKGEPCGHPKAVRRKPHGRECKTCCSEMRSRTSEFDTIEKRDMFEQVLNTDPAEQLGWDEMTSAREAKFKRIVREREREREREIWLDDTVERGG